MLRRLALALGLALAVVVLALVAFVVWASSDPAHDLAAVTTYAPPPAPPGDTLTVATYNVGYLSGMTNNLPMERTRAFVEGNEDRAVELLRALDADVIGFQEIDFDAARSFREQQLDTLAHRLGYHASARAVNWNVRYLPFPGGYFSPETHFGRIVSGQAVLSRYPLRAQRRVVLTRPDRPFLEDLVYIDRLAQVVTVEVGGRALTVVNVHLEAFAEATRERQAGEVHALVANLLGDGTPFVLMGDFNSVLSAERPFLSADERASFASDSTLARLTTGLPLRPIFADSLFVGPGALGTYPADGPTRTIDHVFYPADVFEAVDVRIRCAPPGAPADAPPADHCAVAARLVWKRTP